MKYYSSRLNTVDPLPMNRPGSENREQRAAGPARVPAAPPPAPRIADPVARVRAVIDELIAEAQAAPPRR